MASRPPRYGNATAVQPEAWACRNRPPFMNLAATAWPAAVANVCVLVLVASNGLAQAAFRYSASVSTQPRFCTESGVSSRGMCPRVAALMA